MSSPTPNPTKAPLDAIQKAKNRQPAPKPGPRKNNPKGR